MKTNKIPFDSDLEYLQAEVEYLTARCNRLYIQIRLRDLTSPEAQTENRTIVGESRKVQTDNLQLLLDKAITTEQHIRDSIDGRLSITRSTYGDHHLGIQQLESIHSLTGNERMLLTLLTIAGISPLMMNRAVADLGHMVPLSVEDILTIITTPKNLESWSDGRDMVQRLVKCGLISLDYVFSESWPESIMGATPHLTARTFACISGIDGACDGDDLDSDADYL